MVSKSQRFSGLSSDGLAVSVSSSESNWYHHVSKTSKREAEFPTDRDA